MIGLITFACLMIELPHLPDPLHVHGGLTSFVCQKSQIIGESPETTFYDWKDMLIPNFLPLKVSLVVFPAMQRAQILLDTGCRSMI